MKILSTDYHAIARQQGHAHKILSCAIVTQALDVIRIGNIIDGHTKAVLAQGIVVMGKNLIWVSNEIEESVNRSDSLPSLPGERDNAILN